MAQIDLSWMGAVDALCKLAKEGEAAGVNLGTTKWARLLFERASSFRKWQDRVDDVIASLAVPSHPPTLNLLFQGRT